MLYTDMPQKDRLDAVSSLRAIWESGRDIPLDLDLSADGKQDAPSLGDAIQLLANRPARDMREAAPKQITGALPNTILFPYSRHSSFPELCHLVSVIKPKDIWPCTATQLEWHENGA